jgi:predicted phosphodiesterase
MSIVLSSEEMYKIKKLKKWHLLWWFIIGFLTLVGCEYEYLRYLPTVPKNLNMIAIEKIQQSVMERDDFSFVVLGDNRGNPRTFQRVLKEAVQQKPDFIIHTGDLTNWGRYDEYTAVLEIIENFQVPIVFIIGNHEMVSKYGVRWFKHIFGPLNFYFDIGRCRFVCINNNDEVVESFFKDIAGKAKEADKKDEGIKKLETLIHVKKQNFIVMHVPPPADIFQFHSFTRNSELFMNTVKRNASCISRIFCGHIHGYGETVYGGVPCIVTGGAGAELTEPHKGIISKFNYVLVNVKGEAVKHKVYFLE